MTNLLTKLTKIFFIIIVFGASYSNLFSQYVTVVFPLMEQDSISLSASIVIKAIPPYKFKLEALPSEEATGVNEVVYYEKRSDGIFGIIGTVGARRHNESLSQYTLPDNFAWADTFNDSLLILNFIEPLEHSQSYDIIIKNLKLYKNGNSFTQNAIIEDYFTTIGKEIHLISTNVSSGIITCNQPILANFNGDISVVSIDSLLVIESENISTNAIDTINYTYSLINENKTVSIDPFPLDHKHRYVLNYNGQRLSANPRDNIQYSFNTENIAMLDLKSYYYDKIGDSLVGFVQHNTTPYYSENGEIVMEGVPTRVGIFNSFSRYDSLRGKYIEYEFVRWDSPDIPSCHNLRDNYITANLSCEEIGSNRLSPIFREKVLDTIIISHNPTLCKVNFEGLKERLNDSTFLVEKDRLFMVRLKDINFEPLKVLSWSSTDINQGDYSESSSLAPPGVLYFKTNSVRSIQRGFDERERGIKIRFTPDIEFEPHPVNCTTSNFTIYFRGVENRISNRFFSNPDNIQVFINDVRKDWLPGTIDAAKVACGSYPTGSTINLKVVMTEPNHVFSGIHFGSPNFNPISKCTEFTKEIVVSGNNLNICDMDLYIEVDREVLKVAYSWLEKDENDIQLAFKAYDISVKHSINNQNNSKFDNKVTTTYEYSLEKSNLLKKVTNTVDVLKGSDIKLTPIIRLPNADFLRDWVCTTYDCETIDQATDIHTFHNIQSDKNCLYEFFTDAFKLMYILVNDPNDLYLYKLITDFGSNDDVTKQETYLTGLNSASYGYEGISESVLKNEGHFGVDSRLLHTADIYLFFNKNVEESSVYDGGLQIEDYDKRYDKNYFNQALPKQKYRFNETNVIRFFSDNKIMLQIQDRVNGLELCHYGSYLANITSNIKSTGSQFLANPTKIRILTEGPDWKIVLDSIECNKNEDWFIEDEIVLSLAYSIRKYNIYNEKYIVKEAINSAVNYPETGQYDMNDGDVETFGGTYAPSLVRTKIIRNTDIIVGGVAYDLDAGKLLENLTVALSEVTSALGKTDKSIEVQVANIIANILKKFAENSRLDPDDYLGPFQRDFNFKNAWGTSEKGFYRDNNIEVKIGDYLTLYFTIHTW